MDKTFHLVNSYCTNCGAYGDTYPIPILIKVDTGYEVNALAWYCLNCINSQSQSSQPTEDAPAPEVATKLLEELGL